MVKFIIVSLVVWFIIIKLLKLKFVVYKEHDLSGRTHKAKPEGHVYIKTNSAKRTSANGSSKGEYIDYEEVK